MADFSALNFSTPASSDPSVTPKDSRCILARLALDDALDGKARKRLKQGPSVFVFAVPDINWVPLIAGVLGDMDRAPTVIEVTERTKTRGSYVPVGSSVLNKLQNGSSLAFVSHDPVGLLADDVQRVCDLTVTLSPLGLPLLRKLIRAVTGGTPRGVEEAMVALELGVILACIRPGLAAKHCVANLRRALIHERAKRKTDAPLLAEIPLIASVRAWSDDMIADLAGVKSGALSPDILQHGVLAAPPGTGKTLIGRSLATTAGWNFVEGTVGSWFATGDGALGGVVKNVKKFFDDAMAQAPAIAFLDELDALPDRANLDSRERQWWGPVITLFLTEIDRVRRSGRPVLMLGATNFVERLDDALVRSGRLARTVLVLPPQTETDALNLLNHFAGNDIARNDLAKIARLALGATPAKIEDNWRMAVRLARQQNRRPVLPDLIAAMTPRETRSPADLKSIAIHEIGHAIVAVRLGHHVHSVSILGDGNVGGYADMELPTIVPTRAGIDELVMIGLGGRAADIVAGSGPNAGAQTDLAKATAMLLSARRMQGLGKELVSHAPFPFTLPDAQVLAEIDAELKALLKKSMAIIGADIAIVRELADRLVHDKILTGDNVVAALAENKKRAERKGPQSVHPMVTAALSRETAWRSIAARATRDGYHGQL